MLRKVFALSVVLSLTLRQVDNSLIYDTGPRAPSEVLRRNLKKVKKGA
jgi:hypothetical protein